MAMIEAFAAGGTYLAYLVLRALALSIRWFVWTTCRLVTAGIMATIKYRGAQGKLPKQSTVATEEDATSGEPVAAAASDDAGQTPALVPRVGAEKHRRPAGQAILPGRPRDRLRPADRIEQVHFRDFVVYLYVHHDTRSVDRVLKATRCDQCKRLLHLYLTTRFELSTLSIERHAMEEIRRDSEAAGRRLIETLLDGDDIVEYPIEEAGQTPRTAEPVGGEATLTAPRVTGPEPTSQEPTQNGVGEIDHASRRTRTGDPVCGVLVAAGIARSYGDSRGGTFEAVLQASDGEEVTLRGVMLRDEFERQKINVGDRLMITPKGKQKVVDGDRKRFARNVFDVQILERATQAA